MASTLFQAVGRGYSARHVLNAIGRRFPQQANTIANAYYIGYTAEQILSRIASKKDGKNYDPDDFLTEHEKTQKRDLKQKRKAAMKVAAAAGTAGALAVGAYALMKRNRAIRPDEILPGVPKKEKQKLLPYNQKHLEGPKEQKRIGYMPPIQERQQQVQPNEPSPKSPTSTPHAPLDPLAEQKVIKSADLIKNLRSETQFKNILDGGFDDKTTSSILRSVLPKNVRELMDKSEGGIENLVRDFRSFLKENPVEKLQKQEFETQIQEQPEIQKSGFKPTSEYPEGSMQRKILERREEKAQQDLAPIAPSTESQVKPLEVSEQIQKPMPPSKPLAGLKNGQVGEVESVKNGVATVNVNGNIRKEKASNITQEPEGIEDAVRQIVNSIPENLKSTALQSMVYVPEISVLLTQFYDGKWAWYKDVPEDIYKSIALGTYQPKGQGITGIAEYKPNLADSRGAGFHQEIKINPKFSKENKGITWGYADNEYSLMHSIQKSLHKISKEKYDAQGRIIVAKTRKKPTA